MQFLNIHDEGSIRTIQLNRGTGNPLNEGLVNELSEAIMQSEADEAIKGVLLTGKENFFSVGLDLMELYEYSEADYDRFWAAFMQLIFRLATFDKPLVNAITGHAPAGGCVMAICCDYRVMAQGKFKIGLNEIPVGIIVPPSIFELYAFWLGKRQAHHFILEGKLHTVEEAHAIGLVDEVTTPDRVNEVAMNKLKSFVKMNQTSWRATKKNMRKHLLPYLEPKRDIHFEEAQTQWWRPEVRAALKAYIDHIKKK